MHSDFRNSNAQSQKTNSVGCPSSGHTNGYDWVTRGTITDLLFFIPPNRGKREGGGYGAWGGGREIKSVRDTIILRVFFLNDQRLPCTRLLGGYGGGVIAVWVVGAWNGGNRHSLYALSLSHKPTSFLVYSLFFKGHSFEITPPSPPRIKLFLFFFFKF